MALKGKIMAEIKKQPKPTMAGIMTAIGHVAATALKTGAVIAAPNPITVGMLAKQLWDDYQAMKQAGTWYKANKKH